MTNIQSNKLLNVIESFEKWLSSNNAQDIIRNKMFNIQDYFSLGVIVREWFNIFGGIEKLIYYDFFIDKHNFLPGFIIYDNDDKKLSTLLIVINELYLKEIERIKLIIAKNKKIDKYKNVVLLIFCDDNSDIGWLLPYINKKKIMRVEDFIFLIPIFVPDYNTELQSNKHDPKEISDSVDSIELLQLSKRIINDYLEKLIESLKRLDPILIKQRRIYNITLENAIELTLAFQESNETFRIDNLMHQKTIKSKNLILLGIGGCGKTTLARQIAIKYAKLKQFYFPIYLPLNRYKGRNLYNYLFDIRNKEVDFSDIPICYIFDGYDELPLKFRDNFWNEIEKVTKNKDRIIITGRFLDDMNSHICDPLVLSIRPMIPSQIEEMITGVPTFSAELTITF